MPLVIAGGRRIFRSAVKVCSGSQTVSSNLRCKFKACTALVIRGLMSLLLNVVLSNQIFTDVDEDQYDFHGYCLRKSTLRAYIR